MGRQIPDIAGNATHPRAPLAVGQVGRRIDRHAARRQGTPKGRVGIRDVDMQDARNRCPRAPCLAHFAQRVAETDLGVHRGAIVVRIAPDHCGIEGRDHERDHPLRVAHRQVRGDGAKAGSRIRFGVGHRVPPLGNITHGPHQSAAPRARLPRAGRKGPEKFADSAARAAARETLPRPRRGDDGAYPGRGHAEPRGRLRRSARRGPPPCCQSAPRPACPRRLAGLCCSVPREALGGAERRCGDGDRWRSGTNRRSAR